MEVSKINLFLHEFMANIYEWDYITEIQTTVVGDMRKRPRGGGNDTPWLRIPAARVSNSTVNGTLF